MGPGTVAAAGGESDPRASPAGLAAGLASQRDVASSIIWRRRTGWLVLFVSLFRLLVMATTGLTDTEAYYVAWSRFPAWSYYDHPPLVAWMTWLVSQVSGAPMAPRLGPLLCSLLFAALLYRLAARLFSPRAGFFAVATALATPAYFFLGFLVNPEAPLAPLFVLYLLLVDDLREHDEPWRPLLAGLVVGVAFLAKYTAVLLVPVTLLLVAASASLRRWLRRPSFYLAGGLALLLASPVVAWNVSHQWPSVTLHLVERIAAPSSSTWGANALKMATGQVVLFHPLILPALLLTLGLSLRRSTRDRRHRFLLAMSAPLLLFFSVVMTLVRDAEPHWTLVGYVPLVVTLAGWIDERIDRPSALVRWYFGAAAAASALAFLLGYAHSQTPALLQRFAPADYQSDSDGFNETIGWDRVTAAVRRQSVQLGPDTVVASNHNVLCGHLLVAIDDRPPVYCSSPRRTAFDFLERRTPPAGAPVLYVETARYQEDVAAVLPGRQCHLTETVEVTRAERRVGQFRLYACPAPKPTLVERFVP